MITIKVGINFPSNIESTKGKRILKGFSVYGVVKNNVKLNMSVLASSVVQNLLVW
jgi:hypothetical protein